MAVYMTFLNPGDIVMGLILSHGGHLTHGSAINFSGKLYIFISYGSEITFKHLEELSLYFPKKFQNWDHQTLTKIQQYILMFLVV